jgi:hypothetical protein
MEGDSWICATGNGQRVSEVQKLIKRRMIYACHKNMKFLVEEEKCFGFGRQCLGFDHDFLHLSDASKSRITLSRVNKQSGNH